MSKSELKRKLVQASDAYYNKGEPVMSDAEYDALEAAARAEGINVDAYVGAPAPDASIRHTVPMLSLSKFTVREDALSFLKSHDGHEFIVQPKLDGVSLSLEYEDGNLKRAVTRGDGVMGEDVTHIVSHLPSVSTSLPEPFTGIVRGEVVIHRDELDPKFKNTRNSVAGLLNYRTKSPADAAKYKCRFYAFDLYADDVANASEAAVRLATYGFVMPAWISLSIPESILDAVEGLLANKSNLPYDIDGAVVKISDFATRDKLGNRSNSPRWAFAFKAAGEIVATRLTAVTWQTGSNGAVTPVAELDPADLMGTTIRRASLHNPKFVKDGGYRIGDMVNITRAGDVIPYVLSVAVSPSFSTEIDIPTSCPSCDGKVVQEGNSQQIRCPRFGECPAQLKGKLAKWVARDAADIDTLGPTWIEKLFDADLVKSPADLYFLRLSDLMALDRMGETSAKRMIATIDDSRNLGMRRAIIGLSMPLASEGTAKRLCKHFASLEAVQAASPERLTAIEDIGPAVAKSVHGFLNSVDGRILLKSLRAQRVNLDRLPEDAPAAKGAKLEGKTFVITGKLSVGRAEFAKLLEAAGAKVSGSVSVNTTAVVTDDVDATSGKAKKARDLGVSLITEDQARAML